ncbi:hypothetical protein M405DRAFT_33188 [Rhizopogon salebrosus TDB-379]|nr:hypothetical protein M405DRAFT_33188 [Rhizopogon salebrosus TDB-379]
MGGHLHPTTIVSFGNTAIAPPSPSKASYWLFVSCQMVNCTTIRCDRYGATCTQRVHTRLYTWKVRRWAFWRGLLPRSKQSVVVNEVSQIEGDVRFAPRDNNTPRQPILRHEFITVGDNFFVHLIVQRSLLQYNAPPTCRQQYYPSRVLLPYSGICAPSMIMVSSEEPLSRSMSLCHHPKASS